MASLMVQLPMTQVVMASCSFWSVHMHVWLVMEHDVCPMTSPRQDT